MIRVPRLAGISIAMKTRQVLVGWGMAIKQARHRGHRGNVGFCRPLRGPIERRGRWCPAEVLGYSQTSAMRTELSCFALTPGYSLSRLRRENEHFRRRVLDCGFGEWKRARGYVAPVIELVFPVRTVRPTGFPQRDACLFCFPFAWLGNKAH